MADHKRCVCSLPALIMLVAVAQRACGFTQPRMTLARTLKLFKLPEEPQTPGLRPLTPQDVPQVRPSANPLSPLTSKHGIVLSACDHASNRSQDCSYWECKLSQNCLI